MDELIARIAPPELQTNPELLAVLACLLGGYRWTTPYCVNVIVRPDGHFVGARPEGETDDFDPGRTCVRTCESRSRRWV